MIPDKHPYEWFRCTLSIYAPKELFTEGFYNGERPYYFMAPVQAPQLIKIILVSHMKSNGIRMMTAALAEHVVDILGPASAEEAAKLNALTANLLGMR